MVENKAVIVLSHGSRNKLAQQDFLDFVQVVKEKHPKLRIEHACMELSPPDTSAVVNRLYSEGIRFIAVIPFFLFRGMHIVKDIPAIIEEERQKYSDLKITFGNPLMPDKRLLDIVCDRIEEML